MGRKSRARRDEWLQPTGDAALDWLRANDPDVSLGEWPYSRRHGILTPGREADIAEVEISLEAILEKYGDFDDAA